MTSGGPALLLVAHGSADQAAQQATAAIAARVGAGRSGTPVRLAYLDHAEPTLDAALAELAPAPVVVVPLLLAHAFHVRVDIDGAAERARSAGQPVGVSDVLAPHPLLLEAAADLLAAAAVPAGAAVVLAAAGTTDDAANEVVRGIAADLGRRRGTPATAAFLTATTPTLAEALAGRPGPTAVVPWLLAPGRFARGTAQAAAAAGAVCTDIVGARPALAAIVWERYDEAAAALARQKVS